MAAHFWPWKMLGGTWDGGTSRLSFAALQPYFAAKCTKWQLGASTWEHSFAKMTACGLVMGYVRRAAPAEDLCVRLPPRQGRRGR